MTYNYATNGFSAITSFTEQYMYVKSYSTVAELQVRLFISSEKK